MVAFAAPPDAGPCADRPQTRPFLTVTRPHEPRVTAEGVDALVSVACLVLPRHWIGEGSLEGHELAPVHMRLAGHAPAFHAPRVVDRRGPPDQHLLGVAAAQRTGPAERARVDNGNASAGRPHAHGGDHRRRPCANHQKGVGIAHGLVQGGRGSAAAALGTRFLHRRARDGSVGAVNAAVALLGLQDSAAALAVIEPLAGVGRHRLCLHVAALGAGDRRGELGLGNHFAA